MPALILITKQIEFFGINLEFEYVSERAHSNFPHKYVCLPYILGIHPPVPMVVSMAAVAGVIN